MVWYGGAIARRRRHSLSKTDKDVSEQELPHLVSAILSHGSPLPKHRLVCCAKCKVLIFDPKPALYVHSSATHTT